MNRLLRSGAAMSSAPPMVPFAHHRCLAIAAGMALAAVAASASTEYSADASKTWATRCDSTPAAEVVLGDNQAPVESALLAWFDHAHDEADTAKVGDVVTIMETRPLSATERWRIVTPEAK